MTGVTPTQAKKIAEDVITADLVGQIAEKAISKFDNDYDEAIKQIQNSTTIDKKTLTDTVKQAIIAEIKAIQSSKRSFWQKMIPGGK